MEIPKNLYRMPDRIDRPDREVRVRTLSPDNNRRPSVPLDYHEGDVIELGYISGELVDRRKDL